MSIGYIISCLIYPNHTAFIEGMPHQCNFLENQPMLRIIWSQVSRSIKVGVRFVGQSPSKVYGRRHRGKTGLGEHSEAGPSINGSVGKDQGHRQILGLSLDFCFFVPTNDVQDGASYSIDIHLGDFQYVLGIF